MRHLKNDHENEDSKDIKFKWTVKRKFIKPLQRQLFEAKMINSSAENVIINSKQEFNSLNMKRLSISDKPSSPFQCNNCGGRFESRNTLTFHIHKFHEKKVCSVVQCEDPSNDVFSDKSTSSNNS